MEHGIELRKQELVLRNETFALNQRMAMALSKSSFVPQAYQGRTDNCLIAVQTAERMGIEPLFVMQNLQIIKGNPTWKSTFCIAMSNTSPRFKGGMEFEYGTFGVKKIDYTVYVKNEPPVHKSVTLENLYCKAWMYRASDGSKLYGPTITIEIAVKDGWYFRDGSKWPYMSEQMLMYRSASAFTKLYMPEVLAGLGTTDEMEDVVVDTTYTDVSNVSAVLNEKLKFAEAVHVEEAVQVDTETGEIETVPDDELF